MAKKELEQTIAALNLSIEAKFVPWSQSRNKGEKHRSLNWLVTVKVGDRAILTTDYSAGIAHCPAYKQNLVKADKYANERLIKHETERGTAGRYMFSVDRVSDGGKPILPDPVDVFYSLSLDSEVLDYATFEEWADNFGYEADSRSAERIYRACLEIALKLRAGLGDVGLATLREAAQDY